MDYFDEGIKEDLDKKLFEESYKKQIKTSKKLFKIIGAIFLIFAVIPVIFGCAFMEYVVCFAAIPMVLMGGIFILLGFFFPEKYNYEALKKRQNKFGYLNMYELSAKIIMLEEKNKILEEKIDKLENEIRKLK